MEDRLDRIESDPAFQRRMAESDKAIREGCATSHEDCMARLRFQEKKQRRK
jgi:hypothetical protein